MSNYCKPWPYIFFLDIEVKKMVVAQRGGFSEIVWGTIHYWSNHQTNQTSQFYQNNFIDVHLL
jgi:hypothetical protein